MSQLCEEFGCMPSQLDDESPELLLRITQLRSYVRLSRLIEHADSPKDVPNSPLNDVWAKVQQLRREADVAELVDEQRELREEG